jgi:hypothetical protein
VFTSIPNHLPTLRTLRNLLSVLALTLCVTSVGQARAETFKELGQELGVTALGLDVVAVATGFLDIDLDGVNEAYFYSEDTLHYVDHVDGKLSLIKAVHDQPGPFVPEATGTSVPIDVDRDGVQELMIIGAGVYIYRVSSPGHLELVSAKPSVFPKTRRPSDAAAGDLNGDGWPDVAIAMLRAGHFSALQPGAEDMILMNRGGHFELIGLTPTSFGMTQTLTLADIDSDGRADIVESVNYSGVTGASRILLNRTEAGARYPTFEVSPHTFDQESFGMGTAIEDINGDGVLDIFNTSVGRDYMMVGSPDGSYTDRTSELGLHHEWGQNSMRVQWAPTLSDMDGDGDVDLFVRHGHLADFQLFGLGAEVAEHNLLYLQQDDGSFLRSDVPFDKDVLVGGVDAVLGDVNGDGLPDIALGNTLGSWFDAGSGMDLEADAYLWVNVSPPHPKGRAIALHLKPTISANPPAGARVKATCGDQTQYRHLTHGGKVGAGAPAELFVGWKTCEEVVSVEVQWPSGATSTYTSPDATHRLALTEPEWWSLLKDNEQETWSLTVDVASSGGESICFGTKDSLTTCCTKDEGVCTFPYAPEIKDQPLIQIDDRHPQTLPNLTGQFSLTTIPLIPRPGEPFTIVAQRQGPPGSFDIEAPWIRMGGEKIPWETIDEDAQQFVATAQAPLEQSSVTVQLLYKVKTILQKDCQLGYNFDVTRLDPEGYPTEHDVMRTNWQLGLALSADLDKSTYDPSVITVRDPQGNIVPSNPSVNGSNRLTIYLSWAKIPVGKMLHIYDGETKVYGPLPANQVLSDDELLALTAGVRGFILRTSVVEGGDSNRVFFTLHDEQGYPLPPSANIIKAEFDGAELLDGPLVMDIRPWELTIGFRSTPGAGTGRLRVYDTTDRLLGSWEFNKRVSEELPCDLQLTDGQLGHASIPAGVDATTSLKITPRNRFGEMLGMDTQVDVEVPSYLQVDPLTVSVGGSYETTIRTGNYGGDALIKVRCNGEPAFTLPLEVVGPPPPPPVEPVEEDEPTSDVVVAEEVEEAADVTPQPSPDTDGCSQGNEDRSVPPWLALCTLLLLVYRSCSTARKPL